jgi:ribosome biogenesis protein NSA1
VIECQGCPPLRALTFDALGLIKVIQVQGEKGLPEVVDRWGQPDPDRAILVTSLSSDHENPRLGVARKNRVVDILDPRNGAVCGTCEVGSTDPSQSVNGRRPDNDPIIGLHVFRKDRANKFLECTEKGNAIIRSFKTDVDMTSMALDSPAGWKICGSGSVLCCQVDGTEKYATFGGKGVELNLWDLEKGSKSWTAKAPPRDSIGLFAPTWVTAVTFLSKEDHRKVVIGTSQHQVRLYDIAAQRRPILSFDFREYPIKVIKEDLDGYTVFVGTGSGDLASFDTRTGKLLGSFKGKCSGSIRSIARHPELPVVASCGLDRYLRIWNTKTRELLAAAFLKQQLTSVVIDSNFVAETTTTAGDAADVNPDKVESEVNHVDKVEINEHSAGSKRKSSKKDGKKQREEDGKKSKIKKKKSKIDI